MGLFSGILDVAKVAAPFVGGLFASETQEDINSAQVGLSRENREVQNQFQERMWEREKDWQGYMSGSAYRRAVSDLRAADLNPMLAYQQGGASAGGGNPPSGSAGHVPQLGNKVAAGFSAAAAASQIENVKADTGKKEAEVRNVEADTRLKLEGQLPDFVQRVITGRASAGEIEARTKVLEQDLKLREKEVEAAHWLPRLRQAEMENKVYETQKLVYEFQQKYPDLQKLLVEAKILNLSIPEKLAEAAFFTSEPKSMYFKHGPKSVPSAIFGGMGAAAGDVSDMVRGLFRYGSKGTPKAGEDYRIYGR